ncbi:leucine-rich repeat domain-containing protein [bacterium]
MNSNDIYNRLMEAYSNQNLNKISSVIIKAYQQKEHDFLCQLSRQVNGNTNAQTIGKLFSGLMMLYHPDRLTYYKEQIQQRNQSGQSDRLNRYTSIFSVLELIEARENNEGINKSSVASSAQEDLDPEDGKLTTTQEESEEIDRDFMSALKQKEYGNLDIVYQPHDLENMEGDLELSGFSISDLSGLEHCQNLTALDLSNNDIDDISAMSALILLEELDLSLNNISRLDALCRMHTLKYLDISLNAIEDLSPLMELNQLEYINTVGNQIPESQIKHFRDKGVIIAFS